MSPEEALAWERRNARTAAIAAFVAAGLTLIAGVITGLALRGVPSAEDRALTIIDTLGRQGAQNPPGRLAAQARYLGDHATIPIVAAALLAIGSLALFPVLAYLFRAVRARRAGTRQGILILLATGVVAFALGRAVFDIARYAGAAGFRSSADQSNSAAAHALGGAMSLTGQLVWQLGALALAVALVVISLNAMRVGLLTRFMGVLGIIVGATFVLPLDQQGIIRVFWLGAVGALIAGRWPRGRPPAWDAGEAVPWPTQQQLREQRETAGGADAPSREDPGVPATPAPTPRAQRSSAKKKRRR